MNNLSWWSQALLVGLVGFVLMFGGVTHAQPSDWRTCMVRCQEAIDRMNPVHALWRQALARTMEFAEQRIEAEWEVRDCVLKLKCDSGLPPHFELEGDGGKSFEQFEMCLTICGKP